MSPSVRYRRLAEDWQDTASAHFAALQDAQAAHDTERAEAHQIGVRVCQRFARDYDEQARRASRREVAA